MFQQSLARRYTFKKSCNILLSCRRCRLAYDVSSRQFTGGFIGNGGHGNVVDVGVSQENLFQFRRRHLISFVLDQLFHAIGDEEIAIRVVVAHVASVQPSLKIHLLMIHYEFFFFFLFFFISRRTTFGVDGLVGCAGVADVAFHYQSASDADFARLIGTQRFIRFPVNNLQTQNRNKSATSTRRKRRRRKKILSIDRKA